VRLLDKFQATGWAYPNTFGLFIVHRASINDGQTAISQETRQVSNLGILLDPIADKLLSPRALGRSWKTAGAGVGDRDHHRPRRFSVGLARLPQRRLHDQRVKKAKFKC